MLNVVAGAAGGDRDGRRVNKLVETVFALWELPQNLAGLLLGLLFLALQKVRRVRVEGGCVYFATDDLSVSLGRFLFCQHGMRRIERHEWGHSIQSRMLGPLYLIVVGVPSVARNLYSRAYRRRTGRRWPRYYAGFPERWAERLAEARLAAQRRQREHLRKRGP